MPDMEKVVKALEACRKTDCANCEYSAEACLIDEMISDALALLKEQQERIEDYEKQIELQHDALRGSSDMISYLFHKFNKIVCCKDCKQSGIDSTSYPQYWCSAHTEYHDGDWFCADGERREK